MPTGRSWLGSRSTALDPVANTDTKLLILWSVSKGRVLAQDGVDIREPWPFHGTAEDGELLPKSDILESQLATSLEGRDESGNQRRNHAGMVLADRRLIKFGARG